MWVADIKCNTKQEFYELMRKFQELQICWASGKTATANSRKFNYYRDYTWITLGTDVAVRGFRIFYGHVPQTRKHLAIRELEDIHTLENLKRVIGI